MPANGRRDLIRRLKVKLDLQEGGSGGTDWIDLARESDIWRALVHTVMNIRVP